MNKGILLIVLTDDSKTNLLQLVSPRYPTLFAHHVTLFYNVDLTPEYRSLIGAKQIITLKENVYNEKIQAVTVELDNIASENKVLHITISAIEGTSPVESNTMLQADHTSNPINGNIQIEGVVEFKEFS